MVNRKRIEQSAEREAYNHKTNSFIGSLVLFVQLVQTDQTNITNKTNLNATRIYRHWVFIENRNSQSGPKDCDYSLWHSMACF